MAQIKFIGVPGERHESINFYGTEFPLNKWVDVKAFSTIEALKEHPHFETKGESRSDIQDATIKAVKEQGDKPADEDKPEIDSALEFSNALDAGTLGDTIHGNDAGSSAPDAAETAGRRGGRAANRG